MKSISFYIFIILLITSCKRAEFAHFKITNNSDFPIDSIQIKALNYSNNTYIFLDTNTTKNYVLDMTDIANSDGDYELTYKTNSNKLLSKRFGYYTNGNSIELQTNITIYNDTILFDYLYKE